MRIRRFRTRLLALMLGLLVTAQVIIMLAVLGATGANLSQQARDDLALGGRVFAQLLDSREQELLTTTRVLTGDFAFKDAVASGDAHTIRSTLLNHGSRIGADAAMALELDGSLITTLDEGLAEEAFPFPALLEQAREDAFATGIVQLDGRPVQLVLVPVTAPLPIAWTALGFELDQPLAEELRQLTGLEVSFHVTRPGTNYLASTLPERYQTVVRDGLQAGNGLQEGATTVRLGENAWFTLRVPLGRTDGSVAAYLQASEAETMAPYRQLRDQLLLIAGALLLLSLLAGSLMARQVSRPVMTLAKASARIARGFYDQPVPRPSGDEFGDLADAFNRMQQGIAEREIRIRHQASHDTLTSLPNRNHARELLADRVQPDGRPFAMMLLDLNRFREVNDALGYAIGDRMLVAMARRLLDTAGDDGLAARTGGNEFLLVISGWCEAGAAARARDLLGELSRPVELPDLRIPVSLRAGLVCHPAHAGTPDTLLRRAEIARERARGHATGLSVYQSGEDEAHLRRLRLVNDMPAALSDGQITLVYQPQVRLSDNRVTGVEALARWRHPEFGQVAPDEFIRLAEQTGQIQALTRHILDQGLAQGGSLRDRGWPLRLSLNLSAHDLLDRELAEAIITRLRRHGLGGEALTLEVTETVLMEEPERARLQLDRLRSLGIRLAIDDFGTGYSSLAQLKRLPVQELKIDRSFVGTLPDDPADVAIVRTTIELAHLLGLEVVAEGLESADARALLKEMGCETAQGYGIARPMPADALADWLDGTDEPAVRRANGK